MRRRRIGILGAVGPNLLQTHAKARRGPRPTSGPGLPAPRADLKIGK